MAQDNAALRSVQWHDIGEDGEYPGQSVAKREAQGPSNPFTMPNDEEIFLLRDQERERKKAVKINPARLCNVLIESAGA